MDFIDETLTTQSLNSEKFSPSICAALVLGKKVLNRYYDLTDDSEAYRMAMSKLSFELFLFIAEFASVFHPSFKMIYFERAGWKIKWIAAARQIIRAEYDRKYAPSSAAVQSKPVSVVKVSLYIYLQHGHHLLA